MRSSGNTHSLRQQARAAQSRKRQKLAQMQKLMRGSLNKPIRLATEQKYEAIADNVRTAPMGTRVGVTPVNGVPTLVLFSQLILARQRVDGTTPITQEEAISRLPTEEHKSDFIKRMAELADGGITCWCGIREDGLMSFYTDEGAGIWGGPPSTGPDQV